MTATFSAVREALAGQVRGNVAGLLQVLDRPAASVSAPSAVVQPAPGDFLLNPVMGQDDCDYLFLVTLYVSGGDVEAGQVALDGFLAVSGPSSIMAAVNSDGTLGGVVSSARCNRARGYRFERHDEQEFIAVDFPVEVMT
jgi:hypothetical protein